MTCNSERSRSAGRTQLTRVVGGGRWRLVVLLVASVAIGAAAGPGLALAAEKLQEVIIANTPDQAVPVSVQGTPQVRLASNEVDVAHNSSDLEPYQHTAPLDVGISLATCIHQLGVQDKCFATFPAPPAGKRLVITYVSAYFHYIPSTLFPSSTSVHVQVGDDTTFIDLPAPAAVSSDHMLAASPVSFYYEPDPDSVLRVTVRGFNLFTAGTAVHEGTATIVGYLVPID
jgi:hypothetical protein